MKLRRKIAMASFLWGAYRTYRKSRKAARARVMQARRSLRRAV